MPLAGYDGAVPPAGTEVILGVRPEHVTVRAEAGDGLAAMIDIDEPMGSDSLLWLTFAGQPLSARLGASHSLKHGQPVRLAFDITPRVALRPRDRTAPLRSSRGGHARPFRHLVARPTRAARSRVPMRVPGDVHSALLDGRA